MADLRDHSQPCEHDSIETHTVESSLSTVPWPGKFGRLCPGGRVVTDQTLRQIASEILNEDAAVQMFVELTGRELTGDTFADALGVVDAALGIKDSDES